jgi:Flp pilus assembly protein TadG
MRRWRSGNMVVEAALWIPVMVLLIVAMVQVGKITYLYYSLKKTVYSAARYLSLQPGVNFCDLANDPSVAAALQFAITGTSDGSAPPLVRPRIPVITLDPIALRPFVMVPFGGTS